MMGEDWFNLIGDWFDTPEANSLIQRIQTRRKKVTIFPEHKDLFNAFKYCRVKDLKAVIIGQDPYYYAVDKQPVAHGLSFSSQVKGHTPKSLEIIFEEVDLEYNCFPPIDGVNNLIPWAKEGVLLLNTCLTVDSGKAGSHIGKGWESFIKRVFEELNKKSGVSYMLWGKDAHTYSKAITNSSAFVLKAPHPVVHSYNQSLPRLPIDPKWDKTKCFIGCGHFRKTNEFLKGYGKKEINWLSILE